MKESVKNALEKLNPWLLGEQSQFLVNPDYMERDVDTTLIDAELDDLCLVLTGPRRSGKTTLGLRLSEHLVFESKRFDQLLYLNCDDQSIREWLQDIVFIKEAFELFSLHRPVVLIDEVQRLPNPGLFLKFFVDLQLPIKIIATGSSQLELRSKVQESLTGRYLEAIILPLSINEGKVDWQSRLVYGAYPRIVLSKKHKQILLRQLYSDYIQKDIINFLKINNADIIEKLLVLVAHSSGQLVNYSQLALDCGVTQPTIKEYLRLLEETFVISRLTPFVGNKRTEITRNPVYYFIDNGFRNQALGSFLSLEQRTDAGLLVESMVYQELYKYLKPQLNLRLHYWRTKSGAEVDFVIATAMGAMIPIEVKYRNLKKPTLSRGFRSFVDAYQPKTAFVITQELTTTYQLNGCEVLFFPLVELRQVLQHSAVSAIM